MKHCTIPDTMELRLLAERAYEESSADVFGFDALYEVSRRSGAHVLVAPEPEFVDEAVALLAINARACARKPAVFLTARDDLDMAILKDELRMQGLYFSSTGAPTPQTADALATGRTVVLPTRGGNFTIEDWEVLGAGQAIVVVDFGVSKSFVRRVLQQSHVRSLVTFCTNHVPEINWHTLNLLPHCVWYTQWEWAADSATVAHRGSHGDIKKALVHAWTSEMQTTEDSARGASIAKWISDVEARVTGGDCMICLGRSAHRAVMRCCTASMCFECARKWQAGNTTCANCRSPVDHTSFFVVEPQDDVIDLTDV